MMPSNARCNLLDVSIQAYRARSGVLATLEKIPRTRAAEIGEGVGHRAVGFTVTDHLAKALAAHESQRGLQHSQRQAGVRREIGKAHLPPHVENFR